jgi:hypothetical protein
MLIFKEIDSTLLACLEMLVNYSVAYARVYPAHMQRKLTVEQLDAYADEFRRLCLFLKNASVL